MRQQLLDYLTANLTASIKTSQELPFEEGNNPLYLKNMKRVYLDEPVTEQDQLVPMLTSDDVNQTITRISGYLAVDAKNRSTDLDSALAVMQNAKTIATNSFRKEFDYTTTIAGSTLVYEFEYRFYNI